MTEKQEFVDFYGEKIPVRVVYSSAWPEGSQKNFDDFMTKGFYYQPGYDFSTYELNSVTKVVRKTND